MNEGSRLLPRSESPFFFEPKKEGEKNCPWTVIVIVMALACTFITLPLLRIGMTGNPGSEQLRAPYLAFSSLAGAVVSLDPWLTAFRDIKDENVHLLPMLCGLVDAVLRYVYHALGPSDDRLRNAPQNTTTSYKALYFTWALTVCVVFWFLIPRFFQSLAPRGVNVYKSQESVRLALMFGIFGFLVSLGFVWGWNFAKWSPLLLVYWHVVLWRDRRNQGLAGVECDWGYCIVLSQVTYTLPVASSCFLSWCFQKMPHHSEAQQFFLIFIYLLLITYFKHLWWKTVTYALGEKNTELSLKFFFPIQYFLDFYFALVFCVVKPLNWLFFLLITVKLVSGTFSFLRPIPDLGLAHSRLLLSCFPSCDMPDNGGNILQMDLYVFRKQMLLSRLAVASQVLFIVLADSTVYSHIGREVFVPSGGGQQLILVYGILMVVEAAAGAVATRLLTVPFPPTTVEWCRSVGIYLPSAGLSKEECESVEASYATQNWWYLLFSVYYITSTTLWWTARVNAAKEGDGYEFPG